MARTITRRTSAARDLPDPTEEDIERGEERAERTRETASRVTRDLEEYRSRRDDDREDRDGRDGDRREDRRDREEEQMERSGRAFREGQEEGTRTAVARRHPAGQGSVSPVAAGWGSFHKMRAESAGFAENLKLEEDVDVVIKILDADPVAVFYQHWVTRSQGQRGLVCLEERCPLCDELGDQPRLQVAFNVVVMARGEDPVLKLWTVGPMCADLLAEYAAKERTSPISREDAYFVANRTGSGLKTKYRVDHVKARDLEEDWRIAPLTEAELAELSAEKYTAEDVVQRQSRADLLEIVDEIARGK